MIIKTPDDGNIRRTYGFSSCVKLRERMSRWCHGDPSQQRPMLWWRSGSCHAQWKWKRGGIIGQRVGASTTEIIHRNTCRQKMTGRPCVLQEAYSFSPTNTCTITSSSFLNYQLCGFVKRITTPWSVKIGLYY